MKYFIDTEFIEAGPNHPITLLALGIVAEDGREFYVVNDDADLKLANPWVREHVLPHLGGPRVGFSHIGPGVIHWLSDEKPEFWGYYADYDWVVFCQMFGTMMGLPKGWPMFCRDIKQWCVQLGNPKLPTQSSTEHNALNDARWNREAWNFLAQPISDTSGEGKCRHINMMGHEYETRCMDCGKTWPGLYAARPTETPQEEK